MENYGEGEGFRQSYEKPVKVDGEYDVIIEEVGIKGDGIARVKGFVIFVPNTKKGEKVKVKITRVLRKFAIGESVGAASSEPAAESGAEEGAGESAEEPSGDEPAADDPDASEPADAPAAAPGEEEFEV
ncbi:MAG: TRAM domain-containing protein [archaeon]